MRCKACDENLSNEEATRKSPNTGDYIDMCNRCLGTVVEFLPYEVVDLYPEDLGLDNPEDLDDERF